TFLTRAAVEAVGGVDPSYRSALDYELWLKLGRRFEVRHVERVLAAYRYHSTSKTVAEPAGFLAETVRASRRHGGRLLSPIYIDWYLPRRRPWLYRLVIAWRLLAARGARGVARPVGRHLGDPGRLPRVRPRPQTRAPRARGRRRRSRPSVRGRPRPSRVCGRGRRPTTRTSCWRRCGGGSGSSTGGPRLPARLRSQP